VIRLFKHYVPHSVLLLGLVDFLVLLFAAEAGWTLRIWQIAGQVDPEVARLPHMLTFAIVVQLAMVGVGVYGSDSLHSLRIAIPRLFVSISLAVLGLALIFFLVPAITFWRSNLLYAMLLALVALCVVRLTFGRTLAAEMFKRRILVLGAGPRAARLGAMAEREGAGFRIAGFVSMNDGPVAVRDVVRRSNIANLGEHIVSCRADEVVLALEERRNALPFNDLLRVKTTGVHVTDLSSFLERETGRVDLDSLNPSWLIFSDGFSSGRRLSSMGKRLFDVLVSGIILAVSAPLIALVAILVKLESPGPAFFRQRRVGLYGHRSRS
jgi:FlaA1/EpsC-like NDP-sugar epimerase